MSMTIGSKHFAVLGLIALAAGALGFSGCSEAADAVGGDCEFSLESKMEAFSGAADALVDVAGEMTASAYIACASISTDLGAADAADPAKANPTSDDVQTACASASAALDAAISASGGIEIVIEGGKCSIAAEAQLGCEADCQVDASCEGGSVEARCTPGELSVQCEGTCGASGSCQGSAEVKANCEGTCGATCEGTCEGTCSVQDANGNCAGQCDGKCTGTCTGECKLAANANIECGVNVSCKGECTGTATAPKCEAELTPPSCEMDADCQASCDASAKVEAECTPPSIKVVASGTVDATLTTTLEANLPKLLDVVAKGELAVEAAANIASLGGTIVADMTAAGACAVSMVGDFTAKASAAATASVDVSVSVEASASASGSASAG